MEETLSPDIRDELFTLFYNSVRTEFMELIAARARRREDLESDSSSSDSSSTDSNSDEEEMKDELNQLLDMINQVENSEDSEDFRRKITALHDAIMASEDWILHPYQAHPREVPRILTWDQVGAKFGHDAADFFRFSVRQMRDISELLQIPDDMCFDGKVTTGPEAMCIHLYRLATGSRFVDMSYVFGLLPAHLSIVFNGFSVYLYKRVQDLVKAFTNRYTTDPEWLADMADHLVAEGCPLKDVFGWVDGTHVVVCRPGVGQRAWYCGHHKVHCFKCLGLVLPNGLLLAFGPFDGSMPDSNQVREMDLPGLLEENCHFPGQRTFILYGDKGFAIDPQIITPFRRGQNRDPDEQVWNQRMAQQRMAVEWGFGLVKSKWKLISRKVAMKTLQSPVAIYFFLAVFWTNIHTCINRHCIITDFLGTVPPTVEEYLTM